MRLPRLRTPKELPPQEGPFFHEAMYPAEFGTYTLWLEGYLNQGGHIDAFYPSSDSSKIMMNMSDWLSRLALAVGDFDSSDERLKALEGVIVPENVTVVGEGGPNLFFLEDFSTKNPAWIVAFSTPQLAEFAPILESDFKACFGEQLIQAADPETNMIAERTYWLGRRATIICQYEEMARVLGLEIKSDEIAHYTAIAEEKRLKKLIEMETPEYRAAALRYFEFAARAFEDQTER